MNEISTLKITTDRLNMNVQVAGNPEATALVLIHGNGSSSVYFNGLMNAFSDRFYVIAPDLRGFGQTEDIVIDSTRGARDWSDDINALLSSMKIDRCHMLGWSLGAGVVMQFALDYSKRLLSMILEAPVSPYGFGGTKGVEGTLCYPDAAGCGGGTVNPEFVQRMVDQDRSADDPNSPKNVISSFYFKPPFQPNNIDELVDGLLQVKTGDDRYPGDMTASENWPNLAPGKFGPINALTPAYFNTSGITELDEKPPVLWVRGDSDLIVADGSMMDLGTLGQAGYVPGWPGDDVFPPQPMVSQTKTVLDTYHKQGGMVKEIVLDNCGHSPHIEKADEFISALSDFLD